MHLTDNDDDEIYEADESDEEAGDSLGDLIIDYKLVETDPNIPNAFASQSSLKYKWHWHKMQTFEKVVVIFEK